MSHCGCNSGGSKKRKTKKHRKHKKGSTTSYKHKRAKHSAKKRHKRNHKKNKTKRNDSIKKLFSSKKIYVNGKLNKDEELYINEYNNQRDIFYKKNNSPPIIFKKQKIRKQNINLFPSQTKLNIPNTMSHSIR